MRPRKMLCWYLLFLLVPGAVLFLVLGREAVLNESAKIKPYAVVFREAARTRAARERSERLVIFLGDSSVAQPPWAGKGTAHIPALLEAELARAGGVPGSISVVEWAFDGARIFHYYCLLFEAMRYEPDLIVIPINWRNLGPSSWEEDRRYAFREMSAMVPLAERRRPAGRWMLGREEVSVAAQLLYGLRRPLLYAHGLRAWGRDRLGIGRKKRLDDLLESLPSVDKLMAAFTDERLLQEYYPIDLGEENRRLDALNALSQAAATNDASILFYLTPIHLGEMRGRDGFNEEVFTRSVMRVARMVCTKSSSCMDLSDLLEEEAFLDCFEHYTPEGNERVARELAPEATRLMKRRPSAGLAGGGSSAQAARLREPAGEF